jgi:sugar phosphate isomerase/epimerase
MPAFERAGVVLAIENHDRFKARTLHRIVEQVSSSHLGVCLDTANSLGCGEGIDQVLDTLAGIVVNLHVKDFVTRRLPHNKGFVVEGAPAGKGLLDIPAILARLPRDISAIVELWPPPEDDIEASVAKEHAWAAESVRYMRGVTGCI